MSNTSFATLLQFAHLALAQAQVLPPTPPPSENASAAGSVALHTFSHSSDNNSDNDTQIEISSLRIDYEELEREATFIQYKISQLARNRFRMPPTSRSHRPMNYAKLSLAVKWLSPYSFTPTDLNIILHLEILYIDRLDIHHSEEPGRYYGTAGTFNLNTSSFRQKKKPMIRRGTPLEFMNVRGINVCYITTRNREIHGRYAAIEAVAFLVDGTGYFECQSESWPPIVIEVAVEFVDPKFVPIKLPFSIRHTVSNLRYATRCLTCA